MKKNIYRWKLRISTLLLASFLLFSSNAIAQSPSTLLGSVSNSDQAWVNSSCPRSLGPSLWSNCVRREVSAIRQGIPGLSELQPNARSWILQSCPRSLGPSLYKNCITREKAAILNGLPSFSGISDEDRRWVNSSCPRSLGPSLWSNCVRREVSALRGL